MVPPPPRRQPQRPIEGPASPRRDGFAHRSGAIRGRGLRRRDEPHSPSITRPRPVTLLARLASSSARPRPSSGGRSSTYRVAPQGEWPWGVNPGAVFVASGLLEDDRRRWACSSLSPSGWYAQLAIVAAGVAWGSWANVVGIAIVVYLLRPGVKLLLSGREAMQPARRRRARAFGRTRQARCSSPSPSPFWGS